MPSTFSQNLGVELPADGELDGLWGDVVNANMNILDRAINGVLSLTLTGTSSTLTTSDGVLSDGQYKLLALTGTPPGTHTITIAPNDAQKIYYVANATGQSVVFAQGSGATVTIAAGDTAIIYAFGTGAASGVTNLTDHFAMNSVKITGGSITGITDLAVADGGTGASDAATARTNLGLTIGTNVQAYDAGLQSIAGLTTAADRMIYTTAADVYAVTTLTAAGRALLDDADNAAQRTTLGLTIGTNVQAYDAGLQSISGLTTAADTMIYTTALDTYATTPLTAAGRALLDDADAAAQRTTLGLGTLATQSGTFSGTSSGTNTGDQSIFQSIAVAGQTTVVADSTADTLTLAAGSGVTITTNATTDTITISATGSGGTVTSVAVSGGTTGLTTSGGPITGSGTITLAGTLALANGGTGATTAANARTNLGLGTAATLNVGTGANNIVQLDGSSRLPAVDGSQLTGLVSFPTGGIVLWSGSILSIPAGWALCDGLNGTPDLRDRFVVGAGTTYAVAATGGQNAITSVPAHTHGVGNLANASDGAHTHGGSTSTAADHTHTSDTTGSRVSLTSSQNQTSSTPSTSTGAVPTSGSPALTGSGGAHSHTITTDSAGAHTHAISGNTASAGNASVDVRPLYYALAYIMKL